MPTRPASNMYVIMTGRPFEGFIITGPFADLEEIKRNANAVTLGSAIPKAGSCRLNRLLVTMRRRAQLARWWRELARTGGAYVRVTGPVLGPWELSLVDKAGPRCSPLHPLEEGKLVLDAPVAA